jgi:hypothetical protein
MLPIRTDRTLTLQVTIQKCLERFRTIGEKYVAGTLADTELYGARDSILREIKARRSSAPSHPLPSQPLTAPLKHS